MKSLKKTCPLFASFQDSNSVPHAERQSGPTTAESQLIEMFPGETKENIESALQGNDSAGAIDILLNQGSKELGMYSRLK